MQCCRYKRANPAPTNISTQQNTAILIAGQRALFSSLALSTCSNFFDKGGCFTYPKANEIEITPVIPNILFPHNFDRSLRLAISLLQEA